MSLLQHSMNTLVLKTCEPPHIIRKPGICTAFAREWHISTVFSGVEKPSRYDISQGCTEYIAEHLQGHGRELRKQQ
jgi:hypothetical protein